MRLIDADALKSFYSSWSDDNTEFVKSEVDRFVDLQITIDAEPVRHGRWIFDNDSYFVPTLKCSSCGFACGLFEYKYCPNCGAKQMGDGVSK